MQYHIGRPGVSSLSPGDQIYPSFSGYSSKEAGVWGTGGGLSINSVLTFAEIPPGPAGGKGLSVIPA